MAKKSSNLFAKLELDYADHPKIASLSDAAFRMHVELILYSRKYETDGIIKNQVANRMGLRWDTDVLAELVSNDENSPSLVKLPNGDYYIHGFTEVQETKAEIVARRAQNAKNGAKGGRPRKTQSVTEPQTKPGTQTKAETETETETELKDIPKVADAPVRAEILELLDHLDSRILANGAKKPNRTKTNIEAMRLLIDNDKRTPDEIRGAIDWATNNNFWKAHILNAKKLRDKFDTMRMQANNTTNGNRATDRMRAGYEAMAGYTPHTPDPWAGKELEQ